MGFFKKLFGISTEEETSNYNKNEREDQVPQNLTEKVTKNPTPKQPFNPNMTRWENFFGVNLKKSPNVEWEDMGSEHNGSNIIRHFERYDLNDTYFSYVKALVIGSNATNFFFKCPYTWDDAFDIYFLIERDLVHHGNYTNTAAANKFRGIFDSYYDSFDWEIDGCSIRMSRDIDTGDIELGVWTTFYNNEYLDTLQDEVSNQNQANNEAFEDGDTPMPQQSFCIHLSGALETLHFVHDYMADQLAGIASCYIARSEGDNIQLLEEDSFDEVFSFQSNEIADYLDGRLGALGFKNFDCDDLRDIKAEVFVIPAGDSEDAEDVSSDALVHYEMRYLVDVENVDYRHKTIMDGKMTLNIVGIQYRDNYEDLLDNLEVGTPVILKHDPTNEYDANALAFYLSDGTMLGYLPKKDQPFARIFMKKGYIECEISNIDDTYIDTETTLSEDMVDYDEYNNGDVRISRTESRRGFGNSTRQEVSLEELVKNKFL